MMDCIYNMKLHEKIKINNYFFMTRVAGGWIYLMTGGNSSVFAMTSVFVPYSEEFDPNWASVKSNIIENDSDRPKPKFSPLEEVFYSDIKVHIVSVLADGEYLISGNYENPLRVKESDLQPITQPVAPDTISDES